jgi:hypothetical protein
MKESELKKVPSTSLCQVHTTTHYPIQNELKYISPHPKKKKTIEERDKPTMMYLPFPMETTSLRGLAFEPFLPRNAVGLAMVLELARDAIVFQTILTVFPWVRT